MKIKIVNKKKRYVVFAIDITLRIFYTVFTFPRFLLRKLFPVKSGVPDRILIIMSGFIGDSVLATPAISEIRTKFPRAHLTVLMNPSTEPIFRMVEGIDELIAVQTPWTSGKSGGYRAFFKEYWKLIRGLRQKDFDYAVELRGNPLDLLFFAYLSGAKRRIGYGTTGLGFLLTQEVNWTPDAHEAIHYLHLLEPFSISKARLDIKELPTLSVPEQNKHSASKLIDTVDFIRAEKLILLAPTAAYRSKEWPLEHSIQLCKLLLERDKKTSIVIIGKKNDEIVITERFPPELKNRILDLQGKTNIEELFGLLALSDIIIGPDTGPMHIAAAVGTATLAIFGPTDIIRWRPFGLPEKHIIVSHHVPCSPCGLRDHCTQPEQFKCMNEILPREVFQYACKLIDR